MKSWRRIAAVASVMLLAASLLVTMRTPQMALASASDCTPDGYADPGVPGSAAMGALDLENQTYTLYYTDSITDNDGYRAFPFTQPQCITHLAATMPDILDDSLRSTVRAEANICADFQSILAGTYTGQIRHPMDLVATEDYVDFKCHRTQRQSVDSSGVQGSGGASTWSSAISATGRYVAFNSNATNLVPGIANGKTNVFVRNTETGDVTRISLAQSGAEPNGHAFVKPYSMTPDGRFVAVESYASNFVTGDTNALPDVFLIDTSTATVTLVSRNSSGVQGNGSSVEPSISADGRYVTFTSDSTNLGASTGAGVNNIYVRDLQLGTTSVVSLSVGGLAANASSWGSTISADGRYIGFGSWATNLISVDTNGAMDVFVRDLSTGTTTLVSKTSLGVQANGSSSSIPSLSADGRYIAFASNATNLVTGDANSARDVFVRDTVAGTTTLITGTTAGIPGNGSSGDTHSASISADGRYVAFQSSASNLVTGDLNAASDVFVRDLRAATTKLVSSSDSNIQGLAASSYPCISPEGMFVSYLSASANLVLGDSNSLEDTFVTNALW